MPGDTWRNLETPELLSKHSATWFRMCVYDVCEAATGPDLNGVPA